MQSVALTLDAEGFTDLPEGGSQSKYLACFVQGLFTEPFGEKLIFCSDLECRDPY